MKTRYSVHGVESIRMHTVSPQWVSLHIVADGHFYDLTLFGDAHVILASLAEAIGVALASLPPQKRKAPEGWVASSTAPVFVHVPPTATRPASQDVFGEGEDEDE